MESYCSTGQSPLRAVAPTEEEEYRAFVIEVFCGTVKETFTFVGQQGTLIGK